MESDKKKNAMERTLKQVKDEIAMASKQLQSLGDSIEVKKQELTQINNLLKDNKKTVLSFIDSTAATFSGQIIKIKDAISQRKYLNKTIKALEKSKLAIEIEIIEKQKETFKATGLGFIESGIKEVSASLDDLIKKENLTELQIFKLKREEANLLYSTKKLKTEKVTSEQALKVLEIEARTIEKKREANLKELAREQVKVRSIRNAERDIQAMRRRFTDEYKKVYKSKPRRNTI